MWGLCVGSSAALVDVDGEAGQAHKGQRRRTLVDPTREEAAASSGTVALCSMPALGSITSLEQSGKVSFEELDQVRMTVKCLKRSSRCTSELLTYPWLFLCSHRSLIRSPRRRRRFTSSWQKHCRRWSHRVGPSSIFCPVTRKQLNTRHSHAPGALPPRPPNMNFSLASSTRVKESRTVILSARNKSASTSDENSRVTV